jgi:hypothetical protein
MFIPFANACCASLGNHHKLDIQGLIHVMTRPCRGSRQEQQVPTAATIASSRRNCNIKALSGATLTRRGRGANLIHVPT